MPKINARTFPNDPIGILPDGSLNVVKFDDPPFRPIIIDEEGNVIELDDDGSGDKTASK
jgi:hypothetical protein